MEISQNYKRRLENYLRWSTLDNVGTSGSVRGICSGKPVESGLSPEEVMFRWETKGEKLLDCNDTAKLYRYAAGKNVRDFYVSNWVKDVEQGLSIPEEFLCIGGMDCEEFHKIFKRYPDPWTLRRIWRLDIASIGMSNDASSKEQIVS